MADLSRLVGQDIVDPRREGLPCFGIFASDGGNTYANATVYNSQMQVISPPFMGVGSTTTSYQFGMAGDAMYAYSGDENYSTTTSLSTQASGGVYAASLHNCDQYPMGQIYDCSSTGYRTGLSIHAVASSKFNNSAFLINQILPEGVRPRRFFCINGNTMYEVSSLIAMSATSSMDTINLATYRPAGFTTNTDCYGAACYNERTKTLVVTYGTTTTATQVNVFKSTTVDLNSCTSLKQFFDSATATGFSVTRSTYNTTNRYDRCIVVGDNDLIFMAYRVANNLQADLINPTGATLTPLNTVTGTTSYGQDSGNAYDTKLQLTWDGKWACLFQPYYYYGNGICAYMVSIEDPSRYFTYLDTSSSDGCALMPIGKDSFVLLRGANTDSDGVTFNKISFKHTSKTGTASTFITTSGLNGVITSINNGASINSGLNASTLSGGGYTTTYPNFMTVNWWPINGKRSYEGVVR